MNRRSFLQNSTAVLAGTALAAPFQSAAATSKTISSNDKFRVALIGANGMGWTDLSAFMKTPGVDFVAIADVDQSVLDKRAAEAEKNWGNRPQLFKDYRKLLELKEIDAIIIGVPDHWHCLIFCDSLAAGKHVYCEKPVGNSIKECQVMLAAAKHHGKMVQIGQWQRSGTHYASAMDFVRSGKLGNIRLVKCWAYQGWMKPIEIKPDGPVPDGVDYDMWLGPAPKRPFNPNRFHFDFRWFWDYAGGMMTDWGVHQVDIAMLGMDARYPKSVLASGGKPGYPNDASETPDTMQTVFEFDKFNLLWEHATGIDAGPYGRTEGISFIGNNGTLVVDRGNWAVNPELEKGKDGIFKYKFEDMPDQYRPGGVDYVQLHTQNFMDCIKNNTPEKLNCSIERGVNTAIVCQMGNIAMKTGRKLFWDVEKQEFKDDRAANQLKEKEYHNGWKLPKF